MDYTINEYIAEKGLKGIEDVSSQKNKFASVGEFAVAEFLGNEGFAAKFTKRTGHKDNIAISKDGITMAVEIRVCKDRNEIKDICKRIKADFAQYCELVELRHQMQEKKHS